MCVITHYQYVKQIFRQKFIIYHQDIQKVTAIAKPQW